MPRQELGRQVGDTPVPERVNQPGLERGKGEHPPETIFEKVVITSGPKGNDGDKGDKGDPGQDGAPGVASYRHVQSQALAVWTVHHDLGFRPGGVYVEDSAHNSPVQGRVVHLDVNTLTISFFTDGQPAAMGGEAYIS